MIYSVEKLTSDEIATAVGGKLLYGSGEIYGISTDSRTIDKKTLYIPIKGERFDGHDFIEDVCHSGVCGYISAKGDKTLGADFAIEVSDTKEALLALASYYRSKFKMPVVALTGSVGKTTTKELVAAVVSAKYKTHATKGNLNNEIGVPFTLFGLNCETEAAVIEMGMSNFGEIEKLSLCAKPDIAIITNIGTSHIEFLKSQEGILKAKCEILKGLSREGRLILNGDDPYLRSLSGSLDFKTVFFGMENDICDVKAENIVCGEDYVSFECMGEAYYINVPGVHNVLNALAAICVGSELGLNTEEIKRGLASYRPDGIRQNIVNVNGYKLICDCYNSSPQSVKAALSVLDTVTADRKIAVLGSIGELGDKSEELHRSVGNYVSDSTTDILITVGEDARYIAKEAQVGEIYSFDDTESAAEFIKKLVSDGDAVLIKASRFMKFEKIVETIN